MIMRYLAALLYIHEQSQVDAKLCLRTSNMRSTDMYMHGDTVIHRSLSYIQYVLNMQYKERQVYCTL
jgi:hypothetical protein